MHSYYKLVLTLSFVFDDCLAQFSSKYVLQEEQHQVIFGLLGQKNVVAVLPTGLGESLIYQLFAAVKLKQKEKCRISCIIVTKY